VRRVDVLLGKIYIGAVFAHIPIHIDRDRIIAANSHHSLPLITNSVAAWSYVRVKVATPPATNEAEITIATAAK